MAIKDLARLLGCVFAELPTDGMETVLKLSQFTKVGQSANFHIDER